MLTPVRPGTTCPADVALVGVPMDRADGPAEGDVDQVFVSRTGCAIAAAEGDDLTVSFDGGRTFSRRLDAPGALSWVAVDAARVAVIRGPDLLGLERADGTTVWRRLPPLPRPNDVTSLALGGGRVALAYTGGLVAVSDDDGASWIFQVTPVDGDASITSLTPTALALTIERAPDGPVDEDDQTYLPRLEHYVAPPTLSRWRRDTPPAGAWRYAVVAGTTYYGAAASFLLVTRGGRTVEVVPWAVDDPQTWFASRGSVAYVAYVGTLSLLRGTREIELGPSPFHPSDSDALVGIDAAGGLIGLLDGRVVRYTRRGDWRLLH